MRYSRDDVVRRAIDVLDAHGLADLSMRRLAAELGVQPSALYHHVRSKQELLGHLADEILTRGDRPLPAASWSVRIAACCHALREAMLAYTDGAELVATAHAYRLGGQAPYDTLVAELARAGLSPEVAEAGARTLLHFVFGSVSDEQTHLQAGSAGAIDAGPQGGDGLRGGDGLQGQSGEAFGLGLDLIVDGIAFRLV